MSYYFTTQAPRFAAHLEELKHRKLSYTDLAHLPERRTEHPIRLNRSDFLLGELDFSFLFAYRVHHPNILGGLPQWEAEGREMQVGDVILQQVYLPPYPPVSVKILCGVRILEVMRTEERVGFTYGTLEGHPELGAMSFFFTLSGADLVFRTVTRSEPGTFLSRLAAPLFTLRYQEYCHRVAAREIAALCRSHNLGKVATTNETIR